MTVAQRKLERCALFLRHRAFRFLPVDRGIREKGRRVCPEVQAQERRARLVELIVKPDEPTGRGEAAAYGPAPSSPTLCFRGLPSTYDRI
jgi:hypothetical protein